MAETSVIQVIPKQKPASALPYETLWRAYYNSLNDEQRKYFGNSNALEQSRSIAGALAGKKGTDLINDAYKMTIQLQDGSMPYTRGEGIEQPVNISAEGYNALRAKALNDVNDRSKYLSSMTQKAIDAQKLKEVMGVGGLTDQEYVDYMNGKTLERLGDPNAAPNAGELQNASKRFESQARRNMNLMRVPENLEGDYQNSGFNYLVNKAAYYDDDNKVERGVDKVLSFLPLPFASGAAIARQNGEIAPHETGLDNPRVGASGALHAASVPAFLIPEIGPAIAGGLAALGSSVAKGERSDPYTADYLIDTGIGAAASHGLNKGVDKVLGWIGKDPKSKAKAAAEAAEEEYDNLMSPVLNSEKLTPAEARSINNMENNTYTNKINQAINNEKLSEVDADAFSQSREGPKYIAVPKAIWNNDTKLSDMTKAAEEAERRAGRALKINKDTDLAPQEHWLDAASDEGGYNPLIERARDEYYGKTGFDYGKARPINWDAASKSYSIPDETLKMVASKATYPFTNEDPKTFAQWIFKSLGYDKMGKGVQKGATTAGQFDRQMQLMNELKEINPKAAKLIYQNYGGSPLAFARDMVAESQSYVTEAFNLYNKGELTGDKLMNLADKYADYNIPSSIMKGTKEYDKYLDYYNREFLDMFRQNVRNPGKKPYEYKPYTTIPAHLNQGVDVANGTSGGRYINFGTAERPNPTLAAKMVIRDGDVASESGLVDLLAQRVTRQNKGLSEGGVITPEDLEETLAYFGNLENPGKAAVDKSISRADRAKLKAVKEAYDNFRSGLLIPTLKEASDAEMKKVAAQNAYNSVQKYIPSPKQATYLIGSPYGSTISNYSQPEKATMEESKANETAQGMANVMKRIPIIAPLFYGSRAKKRGSYVPENNLDYRIPSEVRSKRK